MKTRQLKNTQPEHQCDDCEETFTTQKGLRGHIAKKHSTKHVTKAIEKIKFATPPSVSKLVLVGTDFFAGRAQDQWVMSIGTATLQFVAALI